MTPDERERLEQKLEAAGESDWGDNVRSQARRLRERILSNFGKPFDHSAYVAAAEAYANAAAAKFDPQHQIAMKAFTLDAFFTEAASVQRTIGGRA